MFDFLTPEIFDMLVIANLVLGVVMIAGRFYIDMRRPVSSPDQHREQQHDEASRLASLEDTQRPQQTPDTTATSAQNTQQGDHHA